MLHRAARHAVLTTLGTLLLGACSLGSGPTSAVDVPATPIPTPTPTLRPLPTATPTPTPTPVTNLGRREAELLVFTELRSCTDEMADSSGSRVVVSFISTYEEGRQTWYVESSSTELGLSFGRWEVVDATGQVEPADAVARAIDTPGIVCGVPRASLATGLTPPAFSTRGEGEGAATGEQARLRVWLAIYGCFDPAPAFDSFSAYQDSPGRWVVEGTQETLSYGLWLVDAGTGALTPYGQTAEGIAANTACFRKL